MTFTGFKLNAVKAAQSAGYNSEVYEWVCNRYNAEFFGIDDLNELASEAANGFPSVDEFTQGTDSDPFMLACDTDLEEFQIENGGDYFGDRGDIISAMERNIENSIETPDIADDALTLPRAFCDDDFEKLGEDDDVYVRASSDVSPNAIQENRSFDTYDFSETPFTTNSSHQELTSGWLGTTNDCNMRALGLFRVTAIDGDSVTLEAIND